MLSRFGKSEELKGVGRHGVGLLGVAFLKLLAMSKLILGLKEIADRSRAVAVNERLFGPQHQRVVLVAAGDIRVRWLHGRMTNAPM